MSVRSICTVALTLGSLILGSALFTQARAQHAPALCAGEVSVDAAGDRLSITANATPLRDALVALGNEFGLVILTDAALEETVSLELHNRTVREVIARLLREHSYLLSYREPSARALASSPNRLQVFARQRESVTGGSATRTLNEPAAAAPSNDRLIEDVVAVVDALAQTYRSDPASLAGELAAVLSGSNDAALREEAVYALGRINTRSSLDALIGALADPDEQVREAAVYTISERRGSQARPLLEIALTDASPIVREAARDVLESQRDALDRQQ